MRERQAGWYWVKDEYLTAGVWVALEWTGNAWAPRGRNGDYSEVGQRIPTPDEPWQMMPTEPTEEMLFKADTAAMNKEVDTYSPTPTEHPDDGGGPTGYYYRALLAAAPKP